MINAIAELGRFEKSKNPNITNFDVWLEDSYDSGKTHIFCLLKLRKILMNQVKQFGIIERSMSGKMGRG